MSLEIAKQRIQIARKHKHKILDLSYLDLEAIPPEVTELPHLTHLFLRKNRLKDVDALSHLTQLKLLSLGGNRLIEIPKFLIDLEVPLYWEDIPLSHFKFLIIAAQLLDQIRGIALKLALDTTQARDPELARKLARDLTLARDQNQKRIYLHTQSGNLEQAQELASALIEEQDPDLLIVLADNLDKALQQSEDASYRHFQNQALTLCQDLVQELHHMLIRLQNRDLARVQNRDKARVLAQDLGQTLEKALARGLSQEYVTGIYLADNPLQAPPPEIIRQGSESVRTFLNDFIEKESLNEVKVILVGEGASGKTSLVKRLLGDKFDKNETQTHGIKISKNRFEYQDEPFIVNFWDFGGQEIMHATHQFFLTKRCLYLLVLDSRKDEKAEYWLRYIQSFGGEAPVLVVLNKIDENPSFDINRGFLSKKYGNICSYHRVSCKTEEGVDELKRELMDFMWNLELRSTAFPKRWFKVKVHLESMQDDYINYTQYQSICTKNRVFNPESQKVLLELLNDLGVVLNYEQLRLFDTQVLNPLWLTNAVYRIINSPILVTDNGRFDLNTLDTIINDIRYQKENPDHWTNIIRFWQSEEKMSKVPKDKFLFIVAMMKQFEILFQIDDNKYLVPELLPNEENAYKFKADDPILSFVIEYIDFLPTAIIPRLMVKLHKYIYNDQAWKTGMVLKEALIFHSIANIVLDKETKMIYIEIQGKRNRDFLTVIRETIKEINNTYQDLEVTEWIPLPDLYKGERLMVDYQELLGYEEAGWDQYPSGKLRKSFQVSNLLNGIEKPEARKDSPICNIFLSYTQEDQDYKDKLLKHLMPLVRLNKARLWDKNSINAGEEWREEIINNLAKANIVLCLISSNFMACEFCYGQELQQALAAHSAKEKIVIPIKIKEVHWSELSIADIQGLPKNNWLQDIDDDTNWVKIAKGIEAAINSFKS